MKMDICYICSIYSVVLVMAAYIVRDEKDLTATEVEEPIFETTITSSRKRYSFAPAIEVGKNLLSISLKNLEPEKFYLVDFGGLMLIRKRRDNVVEFYDLIPVS